MRACVAAVLVAGGLSLTYALIGLADTNSDEPGSVGDYGAVVVFSAALFGAAAALALLPRAGAGGSRRVARVGPPVAAAGAALAGAGNLLEDGLGLSAFGLAFALGGLALIVGLLAAAVAITTAPTWRGIGAALLAVALGLAVGEEHGFAVVGLGWIALAIMLRDREPEVGG